MSTNSVPEFGEKIPGADYRIRTGAYAVILDEQNRVAAIFGTKAYFLPGGGREGDETAEMALHREILEECGASAEILARIGEAVDYLYAEGEDQFFEKRGTFFLCRFSISPDRARISWLTLEEANNSFCQAGHLWAVRQVWASKRET